MSDIPNEWYCPITCEIMKDPVIGNDGHTYERDAIVKWLSVHNKSPMTKQTMTIDNLVPNIALRNTIEDMIDKFKSDDKHSLKKSKIVTDIINLSYQSKLLDKNRLLVNITATPPDNGIRKPCVLICVLDTSGSMSSSVDLNNGSDIESHGFSRLDLVKHSMKTIVNVMDDNDYVAIVPFSEKASVLLELTQLNSFGKKMATKKIDELYASGQTNIWDGLRIALDIANNDKCTGMNTSIVLLTDGEPNINPPKGIVQTLKSHIEKQPLSCTINTFGFGYSLDSKLLADISECGNGSYAYIPDCTMVGTVFVNFMSNTLATMSKRAKLTLIPASLNGYNINKIYGYDSQSIELGVVQYGQSRDIMFEIENTTGVAKDGDVILEAKLEYFCEGYDETSFKITKFADKIESECDLFVKRALANFISALRSSIEESSLLDAQKCMKSIYDFIDVSNTSVFRSKVFDALLLDIDSKNDNEGQVMKALSRSDWFSKWGKHYLLSLMRAHQLQQCNNFKDKSVQIYGGKLFREIRDYADNVFCKLPAPIPSIKYAAKTHVSNMSGYYNVDGGCFDGEGKVLMHDGSFKNVKLLSKGDKVISMDNNIATIVCVVRTKVMKPIEIVEIDGVKITPWHPIRQNNQWIFPFDVDKTKEIYCDYIYNLVLDKYHVVVINGLECITLGHGYTGNVLFHEYYGTNKIIEDLQSMSGWDAGNIDIDKHIIHRDKYTHVVKKIELITP